MTARVHLHNCLECEALTDRLSLICDRCEVECGYQPILPAINDSEPPLIAVDDVDASNAGD